MKESKMERFTLLNIEDAKQRGSALPWVLVRQFSSIQMGRTKDIAIDWEEVTEVRFFGETEEIRIFEASGTLCAAALRDAGDEVEDETCHDMTCKLEHKPHFGNEITIREYFDYDEDGQLYVAASRLKGWR